MNETGCCQASVLEAPSCIGFSQPGVDTILLSEVDKTVNVANHVSPENICVWEYRDAVNLYYVHCNHDPNCITVCIRRRLKKRQGSQSKWIRWRQSRDQYHQTQMIRQTITLVLRIILLREQRNQSRCWDWRRWWKRKRKGEIDKTLLYEVL